MTLIITNGMKFITEDLNKAVTTGLSTLVLCSYDFLILALSQDFQPTSLDWNDLIFHDNVEVHWQSRSIVHPFK